MRGSLWGSIAVLLLWVAPLAAQPAAMRPADAALEQRFRADLERVSPAAAEAFDQGNAARDGRRLEEAVAAYRRASELAPGVDHPRRRACSVLSVLGRDDEALAACEEALALAPDSPYDQAGVADTLVRRGRPGDLDRALTLARDAAAALPEDPTELAILCNVLLARQDLLELGRCADRLLAVDPIGVAPNYFGAVAAATSGQFGLARRRLEAAHAAGLGDEEYRKLVDGVAAAEAQAERGGDAGGLPVPSTAVLWAALWTLVAWLAVMVVLLGAGYVLSWSTLRAAGRATAAAAGDGTAHEQRLRKLYKLVLFLCGIYFYLSLPILVVIIVGAGAGALYVFLAMGVVPIKLTLLIAIAVIATIGALLRGVFVRIAPQPLGQRLDLDDQPRLRALLQDVASAVGTRRVGAVYLTPGTDMAVTERAGLWASLRGKRAERSLIMGVGLFDGMTQLQLRSVLAHEHGHFRNDDTAGGGFALAVRRSLAAMIVGLARSGAAEAYNPVWWFLRAYYRIYLGVSQGASRLQEVLADRWAIQAYGTAAFVAGYRHVVARSVQFDHQVNATINEVVDTHRPLPNLYQYRPESGGISEVDLATAIDQEMQREPSAYDSHPSPRQRIEWAQGLAVERSPQPDDDEPIWALFEGREALERAMTAEVRERIFANHGISLAESADASDEAAGGAST